MKSWVLRVMRTDAGNPISNFGLLFFRVAMAIELIAAHGLKKIGIGSVAEAVPNPLGLPETFNQLFATGANIIMPLFIIFGFLTRLAVLPILAVTLTGYFVLHANDTIMIKDMPFVYSVCFLLLLFTGSGKFSLDHYFTETVS